MAWQKRLREGNRDTEHDREAHDGTLTARANALYALTLPTIFLIPATVEEPVESLKVDYEIGGFFDIGSIACGSVWQIAQLTPARS